MVQNKQKKNYISLQSITKKWATPPKVQVLFKIAPKVQHIGISQGGEKFAQEKLYYHFWKKKHTSK